MPDLHRQAKAAAVRLGLSPTDYAEALADGSKICGRCGRCLPATTDHFYIRPGGRLRSPCRDCRKSTAREAYKAEKRAALQSV